MESQNENYGNQNHHDNKPWRTRTHRDLQIHHLHGDFKRELKEKHTHTPEAYDDFKHGISKAKEKQKQPSKLWLIRINDSHRERNRAVKSVASFQMKGNCGLYACRSHKRTNTLARSSAIINESLFGLTITKSIWQILEQPKVCGFLWTYQELRRKQYERCVYTADRPNGKIEFVTGFNPTVIMGDEVDWGHGLHD